MAVPKPASANGGEEHHLATGGREEESSRERQRSKELRFHAKEGVGEWQHYIRISPNGQINGREEQGERGSTTGEARVVTPPCWPYIIGCASPGQHYGRCGSPGTALSLCHAWHGHYKPQADPGTAVESTARPIQVCAPCFLAVYRTHISGHACACVCPIHI
jgi:hypothetical protein